MTIVEIKDYILQNFEKVHVVEADGDLFFMYDQDEKFPFATIVTKDNEYEKVSNLNREGFFRINIGLDKETFMPLFGGLTDKKGLEAYMDVGIDFTVEDTLMPHPTYGSLYWVCVVNPSAKTFETLKKYLEISYKNISKK
jgi:hypothetical protein